MQLLLWAGVQKHLPLCKDVDFVSCGTDLCCTGLLEKYLLVKRRGDVVMGGR